MQTRKKLKYENQMLKIRIEQLEELICKRNHHFMYIKEKPETNDKIYYCSVCKKVLIVPPLHKGGVNS